jgi:hypothetical protein
VVGRRAFGRDRQSLNAADMSGENGEFGVRPQTITDKRAVPQTTQTKEPQTTQTITDGKDPLMSVNVYVVCG